MLLSLSRIRWWGEKKPTEEKVTAVSCWRNCLYIPISGGDYQLAILEQILTVGYSWCHCASFLTVSFLCVFLTRILAWLMDFCRFSRNMWEIPVFRAGSSGLCSATLTGQNPMAKKNYLVSVPSSLVYNDTWILCIIHGQLVELGQQFWWSFELGCHGQCSLHQCSNSFLAKNFHPCVQFLCSMVAFVFRQRSRPGESAGSQC